MACWIAHAEEGKEWRELLFACCGGGRNREECSRVHGTGERKKINAAAGVLVEDKAAQKGARRRDEHVRAISSVAMLRGRGRAGQVREGFWRGIVRRVTGGVDVQ